MVTTIAGGVQSPPADAAGQCPAASAPPNAAAAPPTIPTAPVGQGGPPTQDPISLLAEAVGQLKLAVAALNRTADSSGTTAAPAANTAPESGKRATSAAADSTARTQIEKEIADTQDEITTLLLSRQGGIFGPGSLATYTDASMPYATGSLSEGAGFFAEHTDEPEL